jgi:hypothetical protein
MICIRGTSASTFFIVSDEKAWCRFSMLCHEKYRRLKFNILYFQQKRSLKGTVSRYWDELQVIWIEDTVFFRLTSVFLKLSFDSSLFLNCSVADTLWQPTLKFPRGLPIHSELC